MTVRVRFVSEGKTAEVEPGTTIAQAAAAAGVNINLPCGGQGRCGKCSVTVGRDIKKRVLACQTRVEEDTDVTTQKVEERNKVVGVTDHRSIPVSDKTPVSRGHGLAIDIGTTTVAIEVVDMDNRLALYRATGVNRQRDRGEDVLARMQYSADGGTQELRGLVLSTINDLLHTFTEGTRDINAVCVSGNTAMTHLFLGVDPSPIREPPYIPIFVKAETTGKGSGLDVSPDAAVYTMPAISSYVGGDVVSDIIVAGMDLESGTSLLIDVGTNGEVALGNSEMMLTCSSSAGPAFEGSKTRSGMLAQLGAIDGVRIDDGVVRYTVIGGGEPKGICGSGIIDLVAQMFAAGMIDRRGNLTEKADAKDGVFAVAPNVVITQSEIMDIMLTKAAIYSAARTLVRSMGMGFSDLDKIYVAGGFGNFINLDSAITIGLFPDVDRSKYVYLGNASLGGAVNYLLSESARSRTDEISYSATYLDLGSDPAFYDEYTSAQFLPHTDRGQFPSVHF
ncbi:MAG: ASKHA domain-containing protein [Candidatus Methanomethylophilaceae archaeon]|nr:ASKHA domain-containing protein [Candidatus Methanomethylophilaceae archaeon]